MKYELTLKKYPSQEDRANDIEPEVVIIPIKVSKAAMRENPGLSCDRLAYVKAQRIYRCQYTGWEFIVLADKHGARFTGMSLYGSGTPA